MSKAYPNRTWLRRGLGHWIWAFLIISSVGIYVTGASIQALRVNTDSSRTDQSAYMRYAKSLKTTGYRDLGGRNRMPVYPFLQSALYHEELTDEAFFRRGKLANIGISVVALATVFLVLSRSLSTSSSAVLTAITAFTVFVYKAGYFQADVLFYLLFFLLYLALSRCLRLPSWSSIAAAGLLAAVAHLTKASVLPAVVLFVLIYFLESFRYRSRAESNVGTARGRVWRFGMLGLFVLVFLATLSPYLSNSKRTYGRYFYNVNSTFYMWYDSWDEVMEGTRSHGDRVGWPRMDPEEIPAPRKYLREHTFREIAARFYRGARRLWKEAWTSYGYAKYALLYFGFLLALLLRYRRGLPGVLRERYGTATLAFVVSYFAAYLALYSWYTPIAYGVRLPLALFLPLMFTLIHGLETADREGFRFEKGRHDLRLSRFHSVVLMILVYDVVFILPSQIGSIYAGD